VALRSRLTTGLPFSQRSRRMRVRYFESDRKQLRSQGLGESLYAAFARLDLLKISTSKAWPAPPIHPIADKTCSRKPA
jgi:hypothetical protein